MKQTIAEPLITVIVPVYNTAPYLRRCLDSVCGQTYTNLEIICVNDGSTDDSASILAEYAARDARVKVISQPNAGLSAARNAALKVAMGEYVTGVDSDDYMEPIAYQEIMQLLRERPVDIACYGFLVEEGDKTIPCRIYDSVGYHRGSDVEIEEITCSFWSKLWRREFLRTVGVKFPVGLLFEDMVFWNMAAPYAKDFLFCSKNLYHYVQRSGSILHSVDYRKACHDRIKGLELVRAFHQSKGEDRVQPYNLLQYMILQYEATLKITPREGKKEVQQAFRNLCLDWGLDKERGVKYAYPVAELVYPWFRWNPFFSRDKKKKCYNLFWIPVFTIHYKQGCVRYKLLGIRLAKKKVSRWI